MKPSHIIIAYLTIPLLASAQSKTRPFEYNGIYSPTNALAETRHRYGTNHVDYDWDLWGHNLSKIVGNNPDSTIYATIADTLCHRQFCFTSQKLYETIENFILDQYGEGTPTYQAKICIMPQDNKLACTCPRCTIAGNSKSNATPAVSSMIRKLATRFPRHQFFTSSYHSTQPPPSNKFPTNVGVIISAIDLPLRVEIAQTRQYTEFCNKIKQWKNICSKIYIWDYERNFDDYLTPFPCLTAMQKRIQLYRDLGIKGIFLNGSGDEYSTFDDMQTTVLAQMLADPDIDIAAKVSEYFQKTYPTTHTLLTHYYLKLEQRTADTNHILPIYATIKELQESYLDAEEFTQWRKQLDKASKSTTKPERTRLNYLLTALAFTQIQLMQEQNNTNNEDIEEMCINLSGHTELKGMQYYSESYAKIDDFIKEIRKNKKK